MTAATLIALAIAALLLVRRRRHDPNAVSTEWLHRHKAGRGQL